MKRFFCLLILLLPLSAFASSNVKNKDVQRFIKNIETCQHLAGEVSGEPTAEQHALITKANRYCSRAKKQYRVLAKKYKMDDPVKKLLFNYEDLINDISDGR
ncbi:hypothetical protein HZU77_007670 [Neisseriaceae bacterium TC5R-5]|nr:hypothetical protein [Neisseriaceae bacterium TC5R-5]